MVARLAAEEIPARALGNDLTGLFGPGFMGATARGVYVEVPAPFAAAARLVLARPVALNVEPGAGEDEVPEARPAKSELPDSPLSPQAPDAE
jgi:hypothetical protein